MTEKPTMTYEVLERSVRSWQRKTFPKATAATIATHLVSEAIELARSLGVDGDTLRSEVERAIAKPVRDKPEKECGDVFTLAIGVAGELGADTVAVTLPVFKTNLGRTWGNEDPTTGIVEHVEDDEDPTLKERPNKRERFIDFPAHGIAVIGATHSGMTIAESIIGLLERTDVAVEPLEGASVKDSLRWAHGNARAVCIIGDEEVASGFVDVKLTDTGETQRVPLTAAGIKSALPWCKVSA